MATNPNTLKLRNIDIQKEYERLSNKKKNGVTIYSHEFMLMTIAKKFYLSESTISKVLKVDYETDPKQITMEFED